MGRSFSGCSASETPRDGGCQTDPARRDVTEIWHQQSISAATSCAGAYGLAGEERDSYYPAVASAAAACSAPMHGQFSAGPLTSSRDFGGGWGPSCPAAYSTAYSSQFHPQLVGAGPYGHDGAYLAYGDGACGVGAYPDGAYPDGTFKRRPSEELTEEERRDRRRAQNREAQRRFRQKRSAGKAAPAAAGAAASSSGVAAGAAESYAESAAAAAAPDAAGSTEPASSVGGGGGGWSTGSDSS